MYRRNTSRNYQHIQYTYRKIQNMLCRLFWFLEIETTITQFIQKQFWSKQLTIWCNLKYFAFRLISRWSVQFICVSSLKIKTGFACSYELHMEWFMMNLPSYMSFHLWFSIKLSATEKLLPRKFLVKNHFILLVH